MIYSVSFKEAPDGLTVSRQTIFFTSQLTVHQVTAIFETSGVRKEDMHVSFRADRLVVTWRQARVTEKKEGNTILRARDEIRHSHTIPLPEGTKACILDTRNVSHSLMSLYT